jgi:TolA-binding protein
MWKSQMLLSVAGLGLVVLLYFQPRSVLHKNRPAQPAEEQKETPPATSEPPEAHQNTLTDKQLREISRLRSGFLNQTDKIRKGAFADSLAGVFAGLSKPDSAAFYLEQIAALQPGMPAYLRAGDGYYEAFRFAADTDKANKLGEKTRFFYQKVLDLDPRQLDVKSRMAMTFVSTATPMQGIMMLREVIAQQPDNQTALFNLGLLAIQSKQYDKAVDRFKQILGKHPDDSESHLYLGISYVNLGKNADARTELEWVQKNEKDPVILQAAGEYLKNLK